MKQKLKIDIGTKFGSWVIISDLTEKRNNITHWKCQCSCGVVKHVPLNNLMNGSSKQCKGCSVKILGKNKRKGIGLLSGNHWSQIKNKLQKKYPTKNLKIEEAWQQFEKQMGRCFLTNRELILCGYPYNKKQTNAEYVFNDNSFVWLHKDVAKLLNNNTINDIIEISKEIVKCQN